MISSMIQTIEKYYCQLSDSLRIHRNLMSNFSDNLPACYAYAVFFICCFAESFVLPFQRAIFPRYITLGFFI